MRTRRFENPLLPDARLRQLYTGMVEARLIGPRTSLAQGDEACWIPPALILQKGDLVAMPAGSGAAAVLSYVRRSGAASSKAPAATLAGKTADWCMPAIASGSARVWAAVGTATALRFTENVVVCFVCAEELRPNAWKGLLHHLSETPLPLILIILPDDGPGLYLGRCSIPGIAVDAQDAIAVFRVAQESVTRARTHGGAAIVSCVRLGTADPLTLLAQQLIARQVCTAAWLAATEDTVRKRLVRL